MRGVGGRSKRPELEHTDVEALTDVSGTDASFAQACAAVWTCTRVSALLSTGSVCVCSLRSLQFICVKRLYFVCVGMYVSVCACFSALYMGDLDFFCSSVTIKGRLTREFNVS